MLNFAQVMYLALRHVWCCLFDGVARAVALHKNYGMARLSATYRKWSNPVFRPFLQGQMPGQILQPAPVVSTHIKLGRSLSSGYLTTSC